jgi:hypothetical protein
MQNVRGSYIVSEELGRSKSLSTSNPEVAWILDMVDMANTVHEVVFEVTIMQPLNLDRWGRPFDPILHKKNQESKKP